MVTNPMDYVDEFIKAGASGFTFHVEVAKGWLSIFMFFISLLRVGIHRSSIYANSISITSNFTMCYPFNHSCWFQNNLVKRTEKCCLKTIVVCIYHCDLVFLL